MFQSKDYIYEIYRCGSFSAAARNLYITQPAISIAVKKEEQELGQPIFERSSSHLLLTDAGRAYIDADSGLSDIEVPCCSGEAAAAVNFIDVVF